MKRRCTALALLLLFSGGLFLAGCATRNPEESTIPWSRPADWEGQVPGMGR